MGHSDGNAWIPDFETEVSSPSSSHLNLGDLLVGQSDDKGGDEVTGLNILSLVGHSLGARTLDLNLKFFSTVFLKCSK